MFFLTRKKAVAELQRKKQTTINFICRIRLPVTSVTAGKRFVSLYKLMNQSLVYQGTCGIDLFFYIYRLANCALNLRSQKDFLTLLFRRFFAAMLKGKPMPCNHVPWRRWQPWKPLGVGVTEWYYFTHIPQLKLQGKFHRNCLIH